MRIINLSHHEITYAGQKFMPIESCAKVEYSLSPLQIPGKKEGIYILGLNDVQIEIPEKLGEIGPDDWIIVSLQVAMTMMVKSYVMENIFINMKEVDPNLDGPAALVNVVENIKRGNIIPFQIREENLNV